MWGCVLCEAVWHVRLCDMWGCVKCEAVCYVRLCDMFPVYRSVPNAALPLRRVADVITWYAPLVRESSVGLVSVSGSLTGRHGEHHRNHGDDVGNAHPFSVCRYHCNRFNETDSQDARDKQVVGTCTFCCLELPYCYYYKRVLILVISWLSLNFVRVNNIIMSALLVNISIVFCLACTGEIEAILWLYTTLTWVRSVQFPK